MTELILLRHGTTRASLDGVYCGRMEPPLTRGGVRDVRRAAKLLAAFAPHAVYCSDRLRARQTAGIVKPGIEPVCVPWLREIDFGDFEGLKADEIQRRMQDVWQAYLDDYMGFVFPGGSAVRDYLTGAARAVDRLIRENNGRRVLAVTHKGFILAALSHLLHGDSAHMFCYDIRPAGFARIDSDGSFAVLRQLV